MKQPRKSVSLKSMRKPLLIAALSLGWSAASWATLIEYTVANQGGTKWQYSYTITNDSNLADFVDAAIYFPDVIFSDSSLFTNISVTGLTQPAGWVANAYDWSAGLGGFVDFSTTTALAAGASLGLFHVAFDYSGAGTPGSQFFEIYNSDFANGVQDSGNTVPYQPPCTDPGGCAQAPEPSNLALLGTGLIGLFVVFARRRAMATTLPAA